MEREMYERESMAQLSGLGADDEPDWDRACLELPLALTLPFASGPVFLLTYITHLSVPLGRG